MTGKGSSQGLLPEHFEWYERILARFPRVQDRRKPTDCDVICPAHPDHDPSLGADLRMNGRGPEVLLYCRSHQCDIREILKAVGLTIDDLRFGPVPEGCTLEQYAQSKELPVEFLQGEEVALEHGKWAGKPAVVIPYADEEGHRVTARYRITLSGDDRFRWQKGSSVMLYGLHRLDWARERGYVLLFEGESDCHVAWYLGHPALGVPGAGQWKDEWARYLDGIAEIFALVEPDESGREFWAKISKCEAIQERLRKIGG